MKHKDLKPCPLCGRHAELEQPGKGIWNVSCGDNMHDACGLVLFGHDETQKEIIEKWNQRK